MNYKKLICYYSDLYKVNKQEATIKMIIINHLGYTIYRKSKVLRNIKSLQEEKYIVLQELINSIDEVEKKLYFESNEKFIVDIISFDRKINALFVDKECSCNIYNIDKLRVLFDLHKNWNIRYDHRSKVIFKKVYSQSILGKKDKRLKGFKLPKKKYDVRKIEESISIVYKKIIFFDVEMNCVDKENNLLGYWEIVSIGAVKYNVETKKLDKFYSVIKPKFQKVLCDRCKDITGLTQEEINKGLDFKTCMILFEKWIGNGKVIFVSWGKEDIKALKNNSKIPGNKNQVTNLARKCYIDFQKEFSFYHENMNQVIALKSAVELYGLKFEGAQHNALNDAFNLYRVYKKYLEEQD